MNENIPQIIKSMRKIDGHTGLRSGFLKTDNGKIYLDHWKVGDRYFTQWNVKQDKTFGKIGEAYESNTPLYIMDDELEKYLKEFISSQFPELERENINSFFLELFERVNENTMKKYYSPDKAKIESKENIEIIPENSKFQLIYPTSHLKYFNDLFKATGLIGDEYKQILKSVWYNLVSMKIATKQLKLGSIIADGRINILIFLPSGSGKGEIKNTIKGILSKLGKDFIEPTSFHPEQFVGKVRVGKGEDGKRSYDKIPGHLSLDFVIIDEGKELLISKDLAYAESRKYLRTALERYPNNTVTKKSVDIEHKHALSYQPYCCICIFVQPFHIGEEIVLDGDLRRFIVSYTLMAGTDRINSYRNRIRKERDYEGSINKFANFLDSIELSDEFELTDEAIDTFEELFILLIKRGLTRSTKVRNFVEIADYTIQNMLLKFSAIQATQNNKYTIEPQHVELAFLDYAEILEHTYDFIEKKILGNMDYGENWAGAVQKDQDLLKWLYEKGATSEGESTVSIDEYKNKIMEMYHLKEKQAGRKKKKHEENGWIESKKGQHDSKVWLKFKPEEESFLEVRGVRVDKEFREKYMEIINKHFNKIKSDIDSITSKL